MDNFVKRDCDLRYYISAFLFAPPLVFLPRKLASDIYSEVFFFVLYRALNFFERHLDSN